VNRVQIVTWEEAEDSSNGAEANVVETQRDGKDGGATDQDANVGDEKWINEGEIRQPPHDKTAHSVDDTNNGNQERSICFADSL